MTVEMLSSVVSKSSIFDNHGRLGILKIVLVLTFYCSEVARANNVDQIDKICPVEAIVDLTSATPNATGFLTDSGHFFPREIARMTTDGLRGCICDIEPCIFVCPEAVEVTNGTTHVANDVLNYENFLPVYTTNLTTDHDENAPRPDQRFHILVHDPCWEMLGYPLYPSEDERDTYYLLRNGSLFLPLQPNPTERILDLNRFCLEPDGSDSPYYSPKICALEEEQDGAYARLKYIGALVSVPFLLATVIVYSVLPELRNIHGTTLRCYLCCLIVTYVTLGIQEITSPYHRSGNFCISLGFVGYFSFLASFLWLNVICIDTWSRFGGFGSVRNNDARNDRKKFTGYSIYAWGIPIVLTAIAIGMEYTPGMKNGSIFFPGFRMLTCWFSTTESGALYFYGPVGVILACNICLYILTSIKIYQYRRASRYHVTEGDNRHHDECKRWFHLYLKLFIVMGITWSTEVIQWFWQEPKYVWYVTEMFNLLQGVLIFVIFVCDKRIRRLLRERFIKGNNCFSQGTLSRSQITADNDETKNPNLDCKSSLILSDLNTYTELPCITEK